MNANSTIEEIRRELAKLQTEHALLEKSHRRLAAKLLGEESAEMLIGQMAVERVKIFPEWLKH